MKRNSFISIILFIAGVTMLAGCSQDSKYTGTRGGAGPEDRETLGPLVSLSGELSYEDAEWYLKDGEDKYLLHLGNQSYLDSNQVELKEGQEVQVQAFEHDDELSVAILTTDNEQIALRTEDGMPLWAGRGVGGARREADSSDESERPGQGYRSQSEESENGESRGGSQSAGQGAGRRAGQEFDEAPEANGVEEGRGSGATQGLGRGLGRSQTESGNSAGPQTNTKNL